MFQASLATCMGMMISFHLVMLTFVIFDEYPQPFFVMIIVCLGYQVPFVYGIHIIDEFGTVGKQA